MKKSFVIFLLIVPILLCAQLLRMKQIVFLPKGLISNNILCGDVDHDGLNELIFWSPIMTYPGRSVWEIWKYRPINQYELVFADTGPPYYPVGIYTGNFAPEAIGDIDRDSLTDIVGFNIEVTPTARYNIICTQECPNYQSYPESLPWWYRFYPSGAANLASCYFTNDLDNDGQGEILCLNMYDGYTYIFENRGNNQNELVWSRYEVGAGSFAFGDFDRDSLKEFVTANLSSSGIVSVYENTGPDQYNLTYQDIVNIQNGDDVFSGNDVDSDGHPEFFVCFARLESGIWNFYLYMWEATGNNTYQRTLVDHIAGGDWFEKRSKCGDIDADGIDEIVWSKGNRVMVYKATGNNQFQRIWNWQNNHGGTLPTAVVNVYDMNKNGYDEIVISGDDTTEIYEVEAVQVLSPNGGEVFQGDSQQLIRWQTFHPPRCDSLSLFYSIDNGRTYQSMAHGLQSADTSYVWTVPNVNSDSCKIKIIAYGPGWQYDESDGVFRITSLGMSEIATHPLAMTLSLKVFPSPTKSLSVIRYSLPVKGNVSLQLFDISGRLIKTLVNQEKNTGNYSLVWNGTDDNNRKVGEGVYFCILKTNGETLKQKILMVK